MSIKQHVKILFNTLKIFGLCLVLGTLVLVLEPKILPQEVQSILTTPELLQTQQDYTASATLLVVYAVIKSVELLRTGLTLNLEPLKIEVYLPVYEETI